MVQQFLNVNHMFWNGSAFQWVFYVSIILILVFERERTKKVVFGLFPVFMYVIMFNPVTPIILGKFFSGVDLYYVRIFSIIPVLYTMAHGGILILNKTKGVIKLMCVCAISIFVILAGHGIFQESWLQRANNFEKIPKGAIAIINAIPRENKDICVAFPTPLNIYARQIDASIKMPYGRYNGHFNELSDELDKKIPDVANIMRSAGEQAVDYVIVNNNEETREAFLSAHSYPIAENDDYLVYSVEGVNRIIRTYNDKSQISSSISIDADGNVNRSSDGYTTKLFEYDRWGNCTKELYVDEYGKRVTLSTGYASIQRSYRFSGLLVSETYLDMNDEPVMCAGRSQIKYAYDQKRRVKQEKYYDEKGLPLLYFGRYETRYEYNDDGQITRESYYDENGQEMNLINSNFASRVIEYSKEGQFLSETYYDSTGKAVDLSIVDKDNMVWNGDFRAGGLRWMQWGWPVVCEITEIGGKNWMHLVSSGHRWEGLLQHVFMRNGDLSNLELIAGQSYTLRFRAFAAQGSENKDFSFGIHNTGIEGNSNVEQYWTPILKLQDNPQEYTYSFTPTRNGNFRILIGTGQEEAIDGYFTDIVLLKDK